MNNFWAVLSLGLLLGIRHAFDADHVIAVSTMVANHKNPFKSAITGAVWGLGHISTLFLVGLIVLVFKINISENIAMNMELLVGVMLVFLGIKSLLKKPDDIHHHEHQHDNVEHTHVHAHLKTPKTRSHHQSFVIGSVHGLAGSGALMLLVLSTVKSVNGGLFYILVFGLGSIGGMTIISLVLSLPYIFAFKKFPGLHKNLMRITGILSVVFGILIIYEILILGSK